MNPADQSTYTQFKSAYVGEDIIVSPYYDDGENNSGVRKGIYLPKDTWYDYFEGTKYDGPKTIDYPVDPGTGLAGKKLPMFVRAGAIVPLMDTMQYVGEKPESLLTVQVWPSGTKNFTLYEDETPVKTVFTATHTENEQTALSIGAFPGGKYCANGSWRKYSIELHGVTAPKKVLSADQELVSITKAQFDSHTPGWYFDAAKGGMCHINAAGDATKGFSVIASYNGIITGSPAPLQPCRQSIAVVQRDGSLSVSISSMRSHIVELMDVQGSMIKHYSGIGALTYDIALTRQARLVYVLRIVAEDQTIIRKITL
jgi:hypothetical protein